MRRRNGSRTKDSMVTCSVRIDRCTIAVCALISVAPMPCLAESPVVSPPASAASAAQGSSRERAIEVLLAAERKLNKIPPNDPARPDLQRRIREVVKAYPDLARYPRRRYMTPGTRDDAYAAYLAAVCRRIERLGSADFPAVCGHEFRGTILVSLAIASDGQLLSVEIVRSSGNPGLDRKAMAIAQAAGPFDAFDSEMRKNADEIVLTTNFRLAGPDGAASQPGVPGDRDDGN